MKISVKECADTLKEKDNILILTHANPDGDTLGSGFALCRALMKIGKICAVINADDIPKKYNYLFDDIVEIKFGDKVSKFEIIKIPKIQGKDMGELIKVL
mgnify:CR=1 FL=1